MAENIPEKDERAKRLYEVSELLKNEEHLLQHGTDNLQKGYPFGSYMATLRHIRWLAHDVVGLEARVERLEEAVREAIWGGESYFLPDSLMSSLREALSGEHQQEEGDG